MTFKKFLLILLLAIPMTAFAESDDKSSEQLEYEQWALKMHILNSIKRQNK